MKILVLGSGGHAWPIVDAVKQSDFQLQGIIDIEYSGQNEKILGYPIIGDFSVLSNFNSDEVAIIIAIGDRKKRSKYYKKVREYGFKTPSIFHPKAIISDYRKIDDGVFINSGAIINAGVEIGENSIINTGAIIEHEVKIGRNCHICPGVKIGGRVTIMDNAFIGIGASIIDSISIGEYIIIGAGSVIVRNVESHSTVVGVPGKKIK